jgi:glycosyltransferase involved in cell wall biosynthesis
MSAIPKITVLMPAYNAGAYIGEAVQSILEQEFRDFEFLIINDGSKDNTLQVLSGFHDERIRIISRENRGVIASLNEGLSLSRSELIARMDADDISLPGRLQIQYEFMSTHPDYLAVGCDADAVDMEGNFLMHLRTLGHSYEELLKAVQLKVPFIHPCVMFRKDAVLKAGGYPANALHFEDHLLWKKILNMGKACNLERTLLRVRFNPESVTIDERWMGKTFLEIRKRSIEAGVVSPEDAEALRTKVNFHVRPEFKRASYFAMVGKKYLWNNVDSGKARAQLMRSIREYPRMPSVYFLYLLSYIPGGIRKYLYSKLKRHRL